MELIAETTSRLTYDPTSGLICWKELGPSQTREWRSFNAKYANSRAGLLDRNGYLYVKFYIDGQSKLILLHRAAFALMGEPIPRIVDHINRIRTDNRWENIRPCSHSQNHMNARGWGKHGVKGITANGSGFKAQIQKDGIHRSLGTYRTADEAARAYDAAAKKAFGEYARLNFPEDGQ